MVVAKLIAIDFDNVLFKDAYPKVGEPILENIEKVKTLGKQNSLILWTCREGEPLKEALKACEEHGLKFNGVNSNPDWLVASWDGNDCRKLGVDFFVDDKNATLDWLLEDKKCLCVYDKDTTLECLLEDKKSLSVENDAINHPSHYTQGKIECINYIEDKNFNYHLGNAIKYITRAGLKDPSKTIEDLKKAVWYINREIARRQNNEK